MRWPQNPNQTFRWSGVNAGDTAWVLVSAGLVMVMLPGLALFYGGLVSVRSVLVMLQQNIFPLGLVSILWVLAGFSLAFGPDSGGGVIGNLAAFGLRDLSQERRPTRCYDVLRPPRFG